MTRTMRVLVFGGTVAALTSIAWLVHQRSPSPMMSMRAEPAPASPAGRISPSDSSASDIGEPPAKSQVRAIVHQLPDSRVPLDQAVSQLREFADTGDTDAQLELSRRLSACSDHSLRVSEEADQRDRETIEQDKTDEHFDEAQRSARAKNMQSRIDDNARLRQECLQLPAAMRASWLDGIDAAARAGNIDAMRQYASFALDEFDSLDAIIADVDTAIERRDKARAFLLEAAQRGDLASIRGLAYAYGKDGTGNRPSEFRADPALAYAYAYAGTLAGVSQNGDLDWLMSKNAESLDAKQLGDAQRQGRSIYERCCAKH